MKTPDTILLDFLSRLPTTIRDSVLFQCCFGVEAAEFTELATQDYIGILRDFLNVDGALKAYRCAQLLGVVEMTLEPPSADAKQHWEAYDETRIEAFRDIAMRAPLNERHLERARSKFYELRQADLSAANLHRWRMLLWGEHPWLKGEE